MNIPKTLWNLYQLKKNETISPVALQGIQQKKLQKLLHYAWDHSSYYRSSFQQAGISKEMLDNTPLSQFPSIHKQTLLEQFDRLVTVPDLNQEILRQFDEGSNKNRTPFLGKYHVVHSSGSTGKPGYFVYDEQAWNCMLLGIIRGALWNMTMPQILKLLAGKPRILYIAATDGRYGGAMAVGDGIDGVGASQLYLDIKTPLSEWVRQIQAFRPNLIIGYPSAIKILGELAENGDLSLNIVRVVSCGEPLGASLRSYLERTLHTPVINFYGASESLALGVESDPQEGILLFDDMNIIEAAEDGTYLTCLYNFAQPLIRYRLSDRLTLKAPFKNSPCPFPRAVGLLGRNEDILWFEDQGGNREFLHPLAIEGFCIEGLLDYQFRQTGKNSFEMLAEIVPQAPQEKIRSEMLCQMKKILAAKGLSYVDFAVYFVDKILPDPRTGKKQLIITPCPRETRCAG